MTGRGYNHNLRVAHRNSEQPPWRVGVAHTDAYFTPLVVEHDIRVVPLECLLPFDGKYSVAAVPPKLHGADGDLVTLQVVCALVLLLYGVRVLIWEASYIFQDAGIRRLAISLLELDCAALAASRSASLRSELAPVFAQKYIADIESGDS